jgi:pyrroline-5-carboxylate reductase
MPLAATEMPTSLVLVGAGKMGGAMLEGWLKGGLDPASTTVVEPRPSPELTAFCAERVIALNPAAVTPPEVVVLAIKPQGLAGAAPGLDGLLSSETLLISILAGKTVADLRGRLPRAGAVVRAMPNLPASVGFGATGCFASPGTSGRQKAAAQALLARNGAVEWVEDESLIDAVTAVSGSGPAYVFHLTECLAAAAAAAGLPAELGARLARATVVGAGELLKCSEAEPATLRANVTSPGGTTAAALDVLMGEDRLRGLLTEAVLAAKRRAGELSG